MGRLFFGKKISFIAFKHSLPPLFIDYITEENKDREREKYQKQYATEKRKKFPFILNLDIDEFFVCVIFDCHEHWKE